MKPCVAASLARCAGTATLIASAAAGFWCQRLLSIEPGEWPTHRLGHVRSPLRGAVYHDVDGAREERVDRRRVRQVERGAAVAHAGVDQRRHVVAPRAEGLNHRAAQQPAGT